MKPKDNFFVYGLFSCKANSSWKPEGSFLWKSESRKRESCKLPGFWTKLAFWKLCPAGLWELLFQSHCPGLDSLGDISLKTHRSPRWPNPPWALLPQPPWHCPMEVAQLRIQPKKTKRSTSSLLCVGGGLSDHLDDILCWLLKLSTVF